MDYKYIEQLLERYWQCETSIEEEDILRAFFSQKDIPAEFLRYRSLFVYEKEAAAEDALDDDFDAKILAMISEDSEEEKKPQLKVKAKVISLKDRIMPLFKAAAVVAIIVTLGNAAQFSLKGDAPEEDINYANYKDTYSDPSVAYDKVENALELISEGISQAQRNDTLSSLRMVGGNDSISTK